MRNPLSGKPEQTLLASQSVRGRIYVYSSYLPRGVMRRRRLLGRKTACSYSPVRVSGRHALYVFCALTAFVALDARLSWELWLTRSAKEFLSQHRQVLSTPSAMVGIRMTRWLFLYSGIG